MQLPQTSPDGSVVVGVTALTSTAPMSHAAPCGRATPRSSVAGGGQPAAASIAGLPARGTRVSRKLGPGGLFCSGPRSGSALGRSPATVGVPVLRLSVPLVTSPEPLFQRAPPSAAAPLPSRATFWSDMTPVL